MGWYGGRDTASTRTPPGPVARRRTGMKKMELASREKKGPSDARSLRIFGVHGCIPSYVDAMDDLEVHGAR